MRVPAFRLPLAGSLNLSILGAAVSDISALYGFQSAVAPPLSGSAASAAADGTSSSSAAAAHDYLDDLDVTVAHMERRGALVPPKMDIDDDPGGKRENIS